MSNRKRSVTMCISPVVAVLLLIGPLASEGRGDFALLGDEQLTVDSSHSRGLLYDESLARIVSGGSVGSLDAYNTSTVNMSDGTVSGNLTAHDSSDVAVSGGMVDHLYAYNTSTVNMSDGTVSDWFNAYDSSDVAVLNGSIGYLVAHDSSDVAVSGGSMTDLYAWDNSTVNISGGQMTRLYVKNASTVTFVARNFRLTEGLSLDGDRVLGEGTLIGDWYDGTRWAVTIPTNWPSATILLTSEPATPPETPTAEADGPYTLWVGDPLILNASLTEKGDYTIASYMWDLDNDGVFETDAGDKPFFMVYYEDVQDLGLTVGGMYDIHLKVTDSTGLFDTDSSSLRVTPEPATLSLLTLGGLALLRRRKRGMCK